jgi:hypothetical protein
MRVIVMVKATDESEAGILPSTEMLEAMGKYNEQLVNAGIMLAGDGLKPSSQGKRIAFDGANRTVIDGPFAETKEQLGGFVLIDAIDLNEALQIVAKNPMARFGTIEVRPIMPLERRGTSGDPLAARRQPASAARDTSPSSAADLPPGRLEARSPVTVAPGRYSGSGNGPGCAAPRCIRFARGRES